MGGGWSVTPGREPGLVDEADTTKAGRGPTRGGRDPSARGLPLRPELAGDERTLGIGCAPGHPARGLAGDARATGHDGGPRLRDLAPRSPAPRPWACSASPATHSSRGRSFASEVTFDRPERGSARHESVLLPAAPHHAASRECRRSSRPGRCSRLPGTQRRGAELPWWVERMERMVDTAWSMRLVSGESLHRMLDDLAQRGRPGIRVMRQILADRPASYVPPASSLESRVDADPATRRPAGVPSAGRSAATARSWIGRVDFVCRRPSAHPRGAERAAPLEPHRPTER